MAKTSARVKPEEKPTNIDQTLRVSVFDHLSSLMSKHHFIIRFYILEITAQKSE